MIDSKAGFLGPQSENLKMFEDIITDVLRDHAYWRKNFHPSDKNLISEQDKNTPAYLETVTKMRQELFDVLSQLKKGIPAFSQRYLGHMLSEILIPAFAGYFAAMLYNQNNVVAEASPVTIVKELEYIKALCKMMNYPEFDKELLVNDPGKSSWGHLCSGGTLANLESMWAVRNLKFFPLSVKLLFLTDNNFNWLESCFVRKNVKIGDLSVYQLLSISPGEALDIRNNLLEILNKKSSNKEEFKKRKEEFENNIPTIQKLGFANFRDLCLRNNLNFNMPVLLIPRPHHYCWPKIADVIGIGRGEDSVIEIPVDLNFKISIKELKKIIDKQIKDETPVLSVIAISGTTEEGALDPLAEILKLREENEKRGFSFWLHSDAAYGGFFNSLFNEKRKVKSYKNIYDNINPIKHFDSITIDPHKIGFIPYPAGTILFKDSRIREHITYQAPYLSDTEKIDNAFLGKWTLEGSRPGAAAISCYLSQHCFNYDENGHGKLLSQCMKSTDNLLKSFEKINKDKNLNSGFEIILLYKPELNVVCYLLTSKSFIKDYELLNELNKTVLEELSVLNDNPSNIHNFIVSKTDYSYKKYKLHTDSILKKCKITSKSIKDDFSLIAFRSVLMNPLTSDCADLYDEFAKTLCRIANDKLSELRVERFFEKNKRRVKILIIENENDINKIISHSLEKHKSIGRVLDIEYTDSINGVFKKFKDFKPDILIVDLDLGNGCDDGLSLIREFQKTEFNNFIVYSGHLDTKSVIATLKIKYKIDHKFLLTKELIKDNEESIKSESRKILEAVLFHLD